VTGHTVLPDHPEMSHRYVVMDTDDLLRIAADPNRLTRTARGALAEELRKRGLDNPESIAKYEHERDKQIKQEEEIAAAVGWSKRSKFRRMFDHLKGHPQLALLACVAAPGLALLISYAMVTLRVGNGRILSSLLSLTLATGGVCGVAAARSSAWLPIRMLGFLVTVGEFFYAFVFLFGATIGFR
jgi:hypothetical protein